MKMAISNRHYHAHCFEGGLVWNKKFLRITSLLSIALYHWGKNELETQWIIVILSQWPDKRIFQRYCFFTPKLKSVLLRFYCLGCIMPKNDFNFTVFLFWAPKIVAVFCFVVALFREGGHSICATYWTRSIKGTTKKPPFIQHHSCVVASSPPLWPSC